MEEYKKKRKVRGDILKKTWERCKSFSHSQHQSHTILAQTIQSTSSTPPMIVENKQQRMMMKSKSWSSLFPRSTTPTTPRSGKWTGSQKVGVATPKGCLSVYVGPERERFVVKVKYTNHELFKELLEQAENEYGYNSNGPLVLPCEVDTFIKVLYEMDADNDDIMISQRHGCSPIMVRNNSSYYRPLGPSSVNLVYNHF